LATSISILLKKYSNSFGGEDEQLACREPGGDDARTSSGSSYELSAGESRATWTHSISAAKSADGERGL
jgi:hypothetical protein